MCFPLSKLGGGSSSSARNAASSRLRVKVFGQVLDLVRASIALTRGLNSNKDAVGNAPMDVEGILNLVEHAVFTLKRGIDTAGGAQRSHDVGLCVSLVGAGIDAGVGQELVRGQRLEERGGRVEKVDNFLLRCVVGVARRVQGRVAGAVLVPLVLPKHLVVAVVVLPVRLHHREHVRRAVRLEDARDVVVVPAIVAVGRVATVTEVGPGPCKVSGHVQLRGANIVTHHSPWMVQLSLGPVAGSVSQNCTCKT